MPGIPGAPHFRLSEWLPHAASGRPASWARPDEEAYAGRRRREGPCPAPPLSIKRLKRYPGAFGLRRGETLPSVRPGAQLCKRTPPGLVSSSFFRHMPPEATGDERMVPVPLKVPRSVAMRLTSRTISAASHRPPGNIAPKPCSASAHHSALNSLQLKQAQLPENRHALATVPRP